MPGEAGAQEARPGGEPAAPASLLLASLCGGLIEHTKRDLVVSPLHRLHCALPFACLHSLKRLCGSLIDRKKRDPGGEPAAGCNLTLFGGLPCIRWLPGKIPHSAALVRRLPCCSARFSWLPLPGWLRQHAATLAVPFSRIESCTPPCAPPQYVETDMQQLQIKQRHEPRPAQDQVGGTEGLSRPAHAVPAIHASAGLPAAP